MKWVSNDGLCVHVELLNGSIMACTSEEPTSFVAGTIVLARDDTLEETSDEAWPKERTWIGVIKLIRETEVVVEVGSGLHIMPNPEPLNLRVGNTVQGIGEEKILRVISHHAIRYIDMQDIDDTTINSFKEKTDGKHTFDDFAGSANIVARAKKLIEAPLRYHEKLARIGAKPIKGVIFTGGPGTGKTLLARIIASRSGATFYQISGPQIMSKWLGQSEELIRKIFEDAARQEKSIVFFDEIDSLATKRTDESHEASRRIVGQLLSSMDGFNSDENVIVIATTNRPQDIDPALRRPGRFDWEIHFPLPDRADREAILKGTQPSGVADELPHAELAEISEGWSPAELVAIWTEAALFAVTDGRDGIMQEDYRGGFEQVAKQRLQKQAEQQMREKRNV